MSGSEAPDSRRHLRHLGCWIVVWLLVVIWIALSGLLVLGRGDVEGLLKLAFGRYSKPDAYQSLNRIVGLFWASNGTIVSLASLAAWRKRGDIFAVLMIAPALGCLLCLASEKPSDPNWYDILGICSICWIVGSLVTGGYWFVLRRR